jgi:hypothetical protein
MPFDFKTIVTHDSTEECIACRARDMVAQALLPAAAAWEQSAQLPRFAMALHGAAGLLGTMLEEGIPRDEIESALSGLLEEIEQQIAEDRAMGGPALGTA